MLLPTLSTTSVPPTLLRGCYPCGLLGILWCPGLGNEPQPLHFTGYLCCPLLLPSEDLAMIPKAGVHSLDGGRPQWRPSPLQRIHSPPLFLSIQLPVHFTNLLIYFQKQFTNVMEFTQVSRVQKSYLLSYSILSATCLLYTNTCLLTQLQAS